MVMRFTAEYELDPAWQNTYHTMIMNLKWVTTSIGVGDLTIMGNPYLSWSHGSYSMWWYPYLRPIIKLNGTSLEKDINLVPWVMELTGESAYSVTPVLVKFTNGGFEYFFKIYHATVKAERPLVLNKKYKISWDVCYAYSKIAHYKDEGGVLVVPLIQWVTDQIEEFKFPDRYDGPIEEIKKKKDEASEDVDALDASIRGLLEVMQEAQIPEENEWLRWQVIDELERSTYELEGVRTSLQCARDTDSESEAAELYTIAQDKLTEVGRLMNDVAELLQQLNEPGE